MKSRRVRPINPIDVIEAAYDLELDDRAWLHQLAKLLRPLLDGGHGLLAYMFDVQRPPEQWYADAAAIDFDTSQLAMIQQLQSSAPDVTELVHIGYDGLLAMRELLSKTGPQVEAVVLPFFEASGLQDVAAFQTVEPGGRGVVFCAGQSSPRTFDYRTRRHWSRINAHVAAGRRLRSALGVRADEAILDPNGKVHHAEGEGETKSARATLRDAVRRVEKARGKQRSADPEAATEAWTALVLGRWSLIERFERDGRRYIVARRNEHSLPDPRALTPRERAVVHLAALGKSNKLIAYELGLGESTVGTHLSQAMRKLGTRSRIDLIQLVHAMPRSP